MYSKVKLNLLAAVWEGHPEVMFHVDASLCVCVGFCVSFSALHKHMCVCVYVCFCVCVVGCLVVAAALSSSSGRYW